MVIHGSKGTKSSYMTKDMYTTIVKIIILANIRMRKTYSYALINEVYTKFSSLPIQKEALKNDVYNITKSFLRAGYIKVKTVKEGSRVKKYYTITPKGVEALMETKRVLKNAMGEIIKIMP
ncbi:MAG: helix-turn-helix transcriptional regulator [Candidatus Micrarchaeaceae archaeon]|nr:helix-turn-helix transcriptional regulator [Candidatus Marsarchaeota archaeon]